MAGSFFNIKVTGLDKSIANLMKMENAQKEVIPIIENSYKRYQLGAYKRAPEKTGRLKSTLMDDRYTTKEYSDGSYSITQRQGTYDYSSKEMDGAYYLLKQEFTNPRKSRFVRDSIIEEQPKVGRELSSLFERTMWK